MTTTIVIKNSSQSGKVPPESSLVTGELALNLADQKLYSKDTNGVVFEIGTQDVDSLDDLSDVVLGALSNGELLVYNGNEWVNADPGYLTEAEVNNILAGNNPDGSANPGAQAYLKPGDDVSELNNDAGYITAADVPAAPTKTSDLTNDGEDGANPFITAGDIPAIPENTSDLTNDSGFITSADVGDGTITIKKADGSEVGSFTVNQAGDTDISLPADVVPSAPGDGKLSIVDQDDNELFAFTADQATGTETVVKLTAADVGALPDDTDLSFVPLGSWAAIPTL